MKILLTILTVFLGLQINATIVTIGTSNNTNSTTEYPAPYGNWFWGAKHQILIHASELNALGMTNSDINSLAFDVANNNGITLQGFTISIKHTNATTASSLETGLSTVFGPTTYTPSNGWNTHSFSTAFNWDGSSNLLIEVCYNNTEYSDNAIMYNSTTSFNSVLYVIDDGPNVCSGTGSAQTSMNRPNMQIDYSSNNVPPAANFIASTTNTCSGTVSFNDLTSGNPTSWLWSFGDGSSSTSQNPTHTYSTDGVYTVTLTSSNSFGSDTETFTNYISVNIGGAVPLAANCSPTTSNGTLGFGITNFSLNTINNSTGDASEGYGDFTCQQTTLFAGQTYSLSAILSGPSSSTVAVWADWNNDGVFDNTSEKILADASTTSVSFQMITPSSAVVFDTPLRLRISADYDFSAPPSPCSDSDFGQIEDYTIIVEVDTSPPTTDFSANRFTTCNGEINFEDLSTNVPYAWYWDFGDGNSSIVQNASHTYTTSGTFEVALTATNAYGTASETKTGFINVSLDNELLNASCLPVTLGHCCEYGILEVNFSGINNISHDGIEGYQDFSCEHFTSITTGSTYNLEISTSTNNQDTKVWLDFDNNGVFDNSEMIMDAPNQTNPSILFTVPNSGVTFDTPLRLRIMSDVVGNITDACSNQTYGQTEDYGVTIKNNVNLNEVGPITFKTYPNPVSDKLNIQYNGININQIDILDLTGRRVYSSMQRFDQIDVSNLVSGQYVIVLKSESHIGIQKFIKL